MTQTLTTEQLKAIAADEFDACSVLDASVSMARELLANREAQPVYQCKFFTTDIDGKQTGEWQDMDKGFYGQYDPYCRRILYTAPPAPAVPDERAAFNAWNNEDNLPIAGIPAKNAAWLAWQARAMLAEAPEGGK